MHPVNESIPSPFLSVRTQAFVLAWCALAPAIGWAQPATVHDWQAQIRELASQAAAGMPADTRVEVEVGALDPRLKLAPCARITPYLPTGTRLWGRARVGLRCTDGARWSVYLPVTVKVHAKAWTVNQPLASNTVLAPEHLQLGEVDIAAEPSPVIAQPQAALGRALARALKPGQALREADFKPRQWFAAGDTVRIVSVGGGFSISTEGQALSPGFDGRPAKVRIEGGRVVTGLAVASRRVEMAL
jgi:flagellar basal body P-ring formation protein FlgA